MPMLWIQALKIALYCKSVKQHQIPSLYNMNETSF